MTGKNDNADNEEETHETDGAENESNEDQVENELSEEKSVDAPCLNKCCTR